MPQTVEKFVPAFQIQVGDGFYWRNQWWGVDEKPVRKVKYIYIDVGNEDPYRIPQDTMVKVRRAEPTAVELLAKATEAVASTIRSELSNADGAWVHAKRVLEQKMSGNRILSSFDIESFVEDQVMYDMMSRLINRAIKEDLTGSDLNYAILTLDETTCIELLRYAIDRFSEDVWQQISYNSSPMSNAMEIIRLCVKREWVDRHKPMLDYLNKMIKEAEKLGNQE